MNKNLNIDECLINLIREKAIDLLVLAEYTNNIDILCDKINNISQKRYTTLLRFSGCKKIKGLITANYQQELLREDSRYVVMKISTNCCDMIFSLLHAESKLRSDNNDRRLTYSKLCLDITEAETSLQTKNSIILGDFNSNPFETTLISADGFHAVPFKEECAKLSRTISNKPYEKFYNPMWTLLGKSKAPYGTYYYSPSKAINYFWHIFDQVIFRPTVIPAFNEESLEIISTIGTHHLLKNEYKPNTIYSDHLPIFFQIREELLK